MIKTTPTVQSGQQQPAPPVYEVLINEEEKDLPKKLFQVSNYFSHFVIGLVRFVSFLAINSQSMSFIVS